MSTEADARRQCYLKNRLQLAHLPYVKLSISSPSNNKLSTSQNTRSVSGNQSNIEYDKLPENELVLHGENIFRRSRSEAHRNLFRLEINESDTAEQLAQWLEEEGIIP